jgi:hypothetical protein
VAQSSNEPEAVPAGLGIPPAEWPQILLGVQMLVLALLKRLDALEARLNQDSTTSHHPPWTDSPDQKGRKFARAASVRKAGEQPWHPRIRECSFRHSVPVAVPCC